MDNYSIRARVTGVLLEEKSILLVKHNQEVGANRFWSLPGGKVERGETLDYAMKREMVEETGLDVEIEKLLYVCDKPEEQVSRVHFLFLLKRIGGTVTLPSNIFDENKITDIRFVPLEELESLNFSSVFINLASNNFPDSGQYKGHKSNIGL
ncbi:MAG: mismatch repair protein MutT [Paenibacillus sp.]|jgi:ADP-ribose pyrophosphatase YjhB (NUDIX family)|nr:mismatch repair protein MutT [Paenibacillus sp.]